MAKLSKDVQKETEKAESSSFEPVPDGAYHLKLRDVDTTKEGAKGPYWSWEFESIEEDSKGRRFWNNTSLSAAAAFKMKETFEAFGVPLDTDTDEMIGSVVKAIISTRTIQSGSRAGELANQIDRLKPADKDVIDRINAEKKSAQEVADIF